MTGTRRYPVHYLVGLILIIVTLLSGCTVTVSGYARSAEAYVNPQGVYTLIVPPGWGEAAPLEAMPAAESWLLPAGSDGVSPTVFAVTYLVEDAAGIAVNDFASVVLSFLAPISSFDELLPEFESSALSLHTS